MYPLVNKHNNGKSPFLIGKSTIKWPFSIAMLVHQRVRGCSTSAPNNIIKKMTAGVP